MADTCKKLQYSRFDNKQGQYVVRTDDYKEFEELRDYINFQIDGKKEVTVTADEFENKHMCPSHGIQMVSAISKKTQNPYWSHRSSEGEMCFGKGYMPKK